MKRIAVFGLVLALLASFMAPATPFGAAQVQAAAAQTYQVTVGYENAKTGVLVQAFFPETVTIHVGDTVHWVQGSHEIHTVTFLGLTTAPELIFFDPPVRFNPLAILPTPPPANGYDGVSFASSGLMSLDPGNRTSYDLTFNKPGTYNYLCLVHGALIMSGHVVVLPANQKVETPAQAVAAGKLELSKQLTKIGAVMAQAAAMVAAPDRNADGTITYHVMIGFSQGKIDLMRFFPSNLNVRQGDTVEWSYGKPMAGMSMAPHTVTFLNGNPDISLTLPNSFQINPMVLGPLQPGLPLTRSGYHSSGLLGPGGSYSLTIGAINGVIDYECLLHDPSGMVASLNVLPR